MVVNPSISHFAGHCSRKVCLNFQKVFKNLNNECDNKIQFFCLEKFNATFSEYSNFNSRTFVFVFMRKFSLFNSAARLWD